MHLVELIYFNLFPFIPCGESLHIYSSEMPKILLFWSSCLVLNIIDGKTNQFSKQIFRGGGEIQVGKVALCSDSIYGSEGGYI